MLVSFIIPCYNTDKYVYECLKSVYNSISHEYHTLIELIVVNDGSSDNTEEEIFKFQRNYPELNVNYIKQVNLGVSTARNQGLEVSRGKYIAFLDSDDKWYPDLGSKVIQTLQLNDYDIIEFDANRFKYKDDNKSQPSLYNNYFAQSFNSIESKKIAVFQQSKWFVWSRIYKKNLLKERYFEVGRRYEDVLFTPLVYLDATSIKSLGLCIVGYRHNEEGITKNIIEKDVDDIAYGIERFISILVDSDVKQFNKKLLSIQIVNSWFLYRKYSLITGLDKSEGHKLEQENLKSKIYAVIDYSVLSSKQKFNLRFPFFLILRLKIILLIRTLFFKLKGK